jgi:hypothetical protein
VVDVKEGQRDLGIHKGVGQRIIIAVGQAHPEEELDGCGQVRGRQWRADQAGSRKAREVGAARQAVEGWCRPGAGQ